MLGMNLDMIFDDFKSKTMKDQPDQRTNGGKAKGKEGVNESQD